MLPMTVDIVIWLCVGFIALPILAYLTLKFGAVGYFSGKRFYYKKEKEDERPRRS